MNDFDERLRARAAYEDCPLPPGFAARSDSLLAILPQRRRFRPHVAALLAAALLLLTACAVLSAFDYLSARVPFRQMEMSALYEQYAQDVNLTGKANGYTLTIEKIALDDNTCTLFYTVQSRKALPTVQEIVADDKNAPDTWQAQAVGMSFRLTANGENIGTSLLDCISYLDGSHKMIALERLRLDTPIPSGTKLQIYTELTDLSDPARNGARWLFDIAAQTVPSEHYTPGTVFEWNDGFYSHTITVEAVDRSPLGCFLTLHDSLGGTGHLDPEFSLRDQNGNGIPYRRASNVVSDRFTYELLGDLTSLTELTIVPLRPEKNGDFHRMLIPVDRVPKELHAYGYALTTLTLDSRRLSMTFRPDGMTIPPALYPVAADQTGEELFDSYVDTAVSHQDGSVHITLSFREPLTPDQLRRLTHVRLQTRVFSLSEDAAVSIAL